MYVKLYFYLFGLFICVNTYSQSKCYIEHYGTSDGLPQQTIMSILQDNKGFMWFGTWNGLTKFDGYNFYSYRIQSGDTYHMRSNRIDFMIKDKYGYIWTLPYDKEPHRFDPRREKFMSLGSLSEYKNSMNPTKKIKPMPSGKVWLIGEKKGCICVLDTAFNIRSFNKNDTVFDVFEDSNLNSWILTDNGIVCVSADGNSCKDFFTNENKSERVCFYSMLELEGGSIWFGGDHGEIKIYDKSRKKFSSLKTESKSAITFLENINIGEILIVSQNDGFFTFSRQPKKLVHYSKNNLANLKSDRIYSCFVDKSGNIWFEIDYPGVARFDMSSKTMKHFEVKIENHSPNIFPPNFFILEDRSNVVWVHPRGGGFSYYDAENDRLMPFFNEPYSPSWQFSNMMHTAYADKQGNLWLSTHSHGLEKVVFPNEIFKSSVVDSNAHSSINNDIRCIFEDKDNQLWISAKNGKIYIYDSSGKQSGYLCEDGSIGYSKKPLDCFCYCMMQDKDNNIWIGSKGNGIFILKKNPKGSGYSINHYTSEPNNPYSLSHNSIYSIFQDCKGRVWVGTYGNGINLVDNSKPKLRFIHNGTNLKKYPIQTGAKVRVISSDKSGNICIGTTLGLIVFSSEFSSPANIDYKIYTRSSSLNDGFRANDIFDICTTSSGETFFATFGGGFHKITQYDERGFPLKFKAYTTAEGMPSEVVLTIMEDSEGMLWITSEGNLTRFDPVDESCENYSEIVRLTTGQNFTEGARFSSKSGIIYVGHSKGFLSVETDRIAKNEYKPYIAFTNLYITNKNVQIGDNSLLKCNIDDVSTLKLSHRENFFSIEFAALDYTDTKNITYAYKLDGFDDDWVISSKQRIANYTNINPGKYNFRVRSTNSDGVWTNNERVLPIVISPSFWKTGWAYAIYIVLLIVALYIMLRVIFVYYRLKDKVALEHEQTEMKTRFFIDISHEIRTPLTMIIAPLENVVEDNRISSEVKSQLELVLKNANRMLRMVNQILDFRKLQKRKMNIQEIDLSALVADVCGNFAKTAEAKNINLIIDNTIGNCTLWGDNDSIEKLVFNLLSNAFKYTPEGKKIEVALSHAKKDNSIILSVRDEGLGMSKDILNRLFVRFASFSSDKSNPSTGIGLSIVKEVIEKHHAKITVDSEIGKGSCFTVYFQRGTDHFKADDVIFQIPKSETDITTNPSLTIGETSQSETNDNAQLSILIVEDDNELRKFMKTILLPYYTILESENGAEAYNIAIDMQPDFIISDIMMPELDGFGLLKKIKSNEKTSHIPFILLSARTNIESKLAGLDYGADDYITKPFSVKYLRARIENIINLRKRLYQSFSSANFATDKAIKKEREAHITQQDEQFILKMKHEIESNIDNSEYVVNDLATAMAMSRTVFFKKVKSLTGLSPVEFIRDIKIKYAAKMLEHENYSIKEISFMVGIGDTKYFTQCFKKLYNMTPSEYRSKFRN